MSEADGQQEPSMEEILASIRRIISEDGEGEAQPGEEAPDPAEPEEPDPPAVQDEEILAEDPILVEQEIEPMPAPAPEFEADIDDDVLELTDLVETDGTIVDLAQARGVDDPGLGVPSLLPDDAGEPLDDMGEPLISDHTAAVAAGSLAALTSAAGRKIADQIGTSDIGGVTVEELVRQLLRPMLRDWLDSNLPPMVERLVKREIDRLAQQGDGR